MTDKGKAELRTEAINSHSQQARAEVWWTINQFLALN